MLTEVIGALRCPVCSADLALVPDAVLRCPRNHSFDIARQGYVALLDGRSGRLHSDTAPMIAARTRVQSAGLFDPIRLRLAALVGAALDIPDASRPGLVVDAGAGTGFYLAGCLDASGQAHGIGLDLSRYGARAIARAHPRAAAVVADVWRPMPLATAVADALVSVFAPRNGPEFRRVLRPGGLLAVVAPGADHLAELIAPMGMLAVDGDKEHRLAETLGGVATDLTEEHLRYRVEMTADTVADVVAMGPSAFHTDADAIRAAADDLVGDGTIAVTMSVRLVSGRRTD